jgi:hypothetical protein
MNTVTRPASPSGAPLRVVIAKRAVFTPGADIGSIIETVRQLGAGRELA